MGADILTKALPSIKAKHFAQELSPHPSIWGGVLYYISMDYGTNRLS